MAAVTIYEGDGDSAESNLGEAAYESVNIHHRALLGDVLDNQSLFHPNLRELFPDLAPVPEADLVIVMLTDDIGVQIAVPLLELEVIWFQGHDYIPVRNFPREGGGRTNYRTEAQGFVSKIANTALANEKARDRSRAFYSIPTSYRRWY